MILVLIPSLGPILLIALVLFLLGSAVFGIYFGIALSKQDDTDDRMSWKRKTTVKIPI